MKIDVENNISYNCSLSHFQRFTLYIYVRDGWGNNINPLYKQYYTHHAVLSIHGECLLYNERIIIPSSLRLKILHILHSSHLGVSKMKNLARRYVY